MSAELLVYTMAHGEYVHYAPMFRAALEHAYPEYDVRVDVIPNPKTKFDSACRRLLADGFTQPYIYITDIDMMILRERDALVDFHCAEMVDTGLPYSNTQRQREQRGRERMTGLHFVNQDWFEKTKDIRRSFGRRLDAGKWGNCRFDDELMLCEICKSVGPLPPRQRLITRHHGIHMGTLRAYKAHTLQRRKEQLRIRLQPWHAKAWLVFAETPGYKEAYKYIKRCSPTLQWEYDELLRYTKGRARN